MTDLEKIASTSELMEIGRLAIEQALVDMRDSRISCMNRRNGLVIAEKDGQPSSIIRMGSEMAMAIGLCAIAKHMNKSKGSAAKRKGR